MKELKETERAEFVRTVFTKWKKDLQTENSTPLVLISVGHNINHGKLAVMTSQNIPPAELEHALETLLFDLRSKNAKPKKTWKTTLLNLIKTNNGTLN